MKKFFFLVAVLAIATAAYNLSRTIKRVDDSQMDFPHRMAQCAGVNPPDGWSVATDGAGRYCPVAPHGTIISIPSLIKNDYSNAVIACWEVKIAWDESDAQRKAQTKIDEAVWKYIVDKKTNP